MDVIYNLTIVLLMLTLFYSSIDITLRNYQNKYISFDLPSLNQGLQLMVPCVQGFAK
jgi:hypothetical protein